ncbi:hypothetical protein GCM10020255_030850 [Rhodococcus baikonurensis]
MATRGRNCSIANALEVVGEKWSLLVLREIVLGRRRFDEIAAGTGVSRDILAARLRTLVDADVLTKRRYEDHPPRYEYVATESGKALYPILMALMEWETPLRRRVRRQPSSNIVAVRSCTPKLCVHTAKNRWPPETRT